MHLINITIMSLLSQGLTQNHNKQHLTGVTMNNSDINLVQEISIVWSVDDVLSVRPSLNKEQASLVLKHLKNYHDASIGINWDVIETVVDELFFQHMLDIRPGF